MPVSSVTLGGNISSKILEDSNINATVQNNVLGGSGTLYGVYISNTNNSTAVYVKVWNHAGPTIETTAPDFVFLCPAGQIRQYTWSGGVALGVGLSYACVAETAAADAAPVSGGTAGNTAPAKSVLVRILAS